MPRGSVGLNSRIARLENIVQGLEPRVNTLFQQNENLLNNPWVPQGSWAASSNTPTLANGDAADAGSSYLASDGGTVDFGAGGITFAGGDLVSKNAAGVWFKSAGLGSVIAGDATVADARATLDVMTVGGVDSRQLSKAPVNGVYLDGVDDYINLGDQSLLEFGDSSDDVAFSETFIFEIDDLTTAFPLSSKITGSAPNNERSVQVLTNGKIEVKLYDSSTSVYIGQTGNSVLTTGRVYFVAVTYSGSGTSAGIKIYVGEVAESLTLTEAGSYTAMHAGSASAYLGRVSSTYGEGKIYSYVPWNRELSVDDVALLAANGNQPEPSDRWGGTFSTASDFSAGVDGFTALGSATITGNVDSIGGENDWLSVEATTTIAGSGKTTAETFAAGRMFRVKGKFVIKSGNTTANSLSLRNSSGFDIRSGGFFVTPGAADTVIEFDETFQLIQSVTSLSFYLATPSGLTVTVGDIGYIKDLQWGYVGAIASIQGRNFESDSAVDESTNEINGPFLGGATRLFEPKAQSSGAFTPQLYFGGNLQTVSVAEGNWWRDGVNDNLIFYQIRLETPSAVSDAGNVIIQGMPFNSVNDAAKRFTADILLANANAASYSGVAKALVNVNDDTITVYQTTTSGVTPLTNSECTTSTIISITGFYERA